MLTDAAIWKLKKYVEIFFYLRSVEILFTFYSNLINDEKFVRYTENLYAAQSLYHRDLATL